MGKERGRTTAREPAARIDWCDIYKGISICVVVFAHVTYEFRWNLNQYIYQFVIAGLFFISGYTAKARERSFFEEIIRKFYKLMVPWYVLHIVGLWIFWLFQQIGILGAVSTTQYTVGYGGALVGLLDGSNIIYCDWLGAMWFVPVLFVAEVILTVLTRLFKKDSLIFAASILIFLGGERMAALGICYNSLDLAGIAQAFLVWGYMFQKVKMRETHGGWLALESLLIGGAWWGIIRLGFRDMIDWPIRMVNGAVDYVMPFLGIWLTVTVSRLLARTNLGKKLFVYLGQNSMGIMCFHFVGFKAAYLILILLGQMEAGDFYRLIPSAGMEMGGALIYVVGIAVSVAIWRGLNRFPAVSVLLGGGNAGKIYRGLTDYRAVRSLREVYDFLAGLLRESFQQYKEFIRKQKHLGRKAALVIAGIVACIVIRVLQYCGEVEILFPYHGSKVILGDGWFAQSDTEDYRWFSGSAAVKVFLVDQDELSISGYIPDTVEDITYLLIRVNGEEIYRETAVSESLIELKLDIAEYVRPFRENIFEIETDGIRIPGEGDEDQRSFSALINSIVVY